MAQTQNRIYYGWYITGIAFFAYFFSTGTGFYAFNAFLEPLCRLRGWSRTDLNIALVIATAFGFACQYIYGTLLIRTGIRILMLIGAIIGGLSFICIPRAQSLWQFYLFYILLFMGNGAYGGIVANTAVNNWFLQKRGKALGLATAGMSASGAVLPLGLLFLINSAGINIAALFIGIMLMGFGPLAWFVVRDWPEDLGMGPDGIPLDSIPIVHTVSGPDLQKNIVRYQQDWRLNTLARNATFWKIGVAFALLMIGTVGVMSQLKPRFTDIGFNHTSAMIMMGITALAGSIGKYIWGSLCDRFDTRRVAYIMAIGNIAGLALSLCKNSFTALFFFILVYGFSMGGTLSVYPVIISSVYGRKNFPSVLRYISIFLSLQLIGYLIAGVSFDHTGSYDAAYLVFIGLDMIAAVLLFSL